MSSYLIADSNIYWKEKIVNLTANVPFHIEASKDINCIIVRNPSSSEVIRLGLNSNTTTSNYESTAPIDGYGFLVRPFGFRDAYIVSSGNVNNVTVIETIEKNIAVLFQNMGTPPTGSVSVSTTVGLKASELSLDGNKYLNTVVKTLPNITIGTELPAGTKKIGSFDLANAIPAGNNKIGKIEIDTELPAGTKKIGSIEVVNNANKLAINSDGSINIKSSSGTMRTGVRGGITTTAVEVYSTSLYFDSCLLWADSLNTDDILIGDSLLQNYVLKPGEKISIDRIDINTLWCKAVSGTQCINFMGVLK